MVLLVPMMILNKINTAIIFICMVIYANSSFALNLCSSVYNDLESFPIETEHLEKDKFFEVGLGVVYPEGAGPVDVQIKLSRADLFKDEPVKQGLAKFVNKAISPLSKLLGVNKLNVVINSILRDLSDDPYPVKLARAFDLKIFTHKSSIEKSVPAQGPVIGIAQHPRAGVDAIAMAAILSTVRKNPDTLIVLLDSLKELPGVHENAVLIDVKGTPESKQNNQRARQRIIDHLKAGGSVVMFPSGRNSGKSEITNELYDDAWKPGIYDFIKQVPETTVVPMFVEGGLSELYYKIRNNLGIQYTTPFLPAQLAGQVGQNITVKVGDSITGKEIIQISEKYVHESADSELSVVNVFLGYLRSRVYSLKNKPTHEFQYLDLSGK